jgi:hypothetical protein
MFGAAFLQGAHGGIVVNNDSSDRLSTALLQAGTANQRMGEGLRPG